MNFTSNWIDHATYVRTDSPYYVRPSVPKRLDVKIPNSSINKKYNAN